MPGERRHAAYLEPEWLRALGIEQRLPVAAEVALTVCGTSFHAAQVGDRAAAPVFRRPVWLVTGESDSSLGELAEGVSVCRPELERSWSTSRRLTRPSSSSARGARLSAGAHHTEQLLHRRLAAIDDDERLEGVRAAYG